MRREIVSCAVPEIIRAPRLNRRIQQLIELHRPGPSDNRPVAPDMPAFIEDKLSPPQLTTLPHATPPCRTSLWSLALPTALPCCPTVEGRGTFGNPSDEPAKVRMRPQGLNRMIVPGELPLCQRSMYFTMTDLMKQHDRTTLAALQLRDQVMQALRRLRRDGPAVEGTDRIGHGIASTRHDTAQD